MLEKQVVSIQLDKSYIQNMNEVGFFVRQGRYVKLPIHLEPVFLVLRVGVTS